MYLLPFRMHTFRYPNNLLYTFVSIKKYYTCTCRGSKCLGTGSCKLEVRLYSSCEANYEKSHAILKCKLAVLISINLIGSVTACAYFLLELQQSQANRRFEEIY